MTAPDLAAVACALGNDRVGPGARSASAYCPVCDYGKKMLSLRIKDGRLLVWCANKCDQREVFREVARLAKLGGNGFKLAGPVKVDPDEEAVREAQFRKFHTRWINAAEVSEHAIARRYLENRGCVVPKKGSPVRALDHAYHWPTQTRWPALIAAIDDATTLQPIGFQTTFLAMDGTGKAPVDQNKLTPKGLRFHGGVVRVTQHYLERDYRFVPVLLGLTEGIESALSLAHMGFTCWATLTAGNMAEFPVHEEVGRLVVAIDPDKAGKRAAYAVARRYHAAGARVSFIRPREGDVNDLVRGAA